MPIGEIRLFASTFAPLGWKLCEGQLLDAREHPELTLRMGKTFGGDGETTIALPDLRGRAPMHYGNSINLGDARAISIDAPTQWENVPAKIHINHIMLLQNLQRMDEGEPFIGEIRIFAGRSASRGWIPCDGRAMRIFDNTALYSLLGDTYSPRRNSELFWLPNLEGRMPLHPRTRDDVGTTAGARGFDVDSSATTHLAMRYYIAGAGIFPQRE